MCAPSFLVGARLTTCMRAHAHSLKGTLVMTQILHHSCSLMTHQFVPRYAYICSEDGLKKFHLKMFGRYIDTMKGVPKHYSAINGDSTIVINFIK